MELPGKRELREQILHQMDGRTSYVSDKDVYREIDKAILRSSHGGYGTLSEKEELRRQMFYENSNKNSACQCKTEQRKKLFMWMRHCTDYVSDICCFNGGIWNDPRTACIGGCLLSNLPYYVPPSFREKHQSTSGA